MLENTTPPAANQEQNTIASPVAGHTAMSFPQPEHTREAALYYAANGLHIIPVYSVVDGRCTCGDPHTDDPKQIGKHPATPHGYKDATTDPAKITGWFSGELRNIGVATGDVSGVFSVDIDGELGEENLREMEKQHGAVPTTLEERTGRGRQLFFQFPKGSGISGFSRSDLKIDIRADGNYTILPPSRHFNGKVYKWLDPATPIAPAPQFIIDYAQTKGDSFRPKHLNANKHVPKNNQALLNANLPEYLRGLTGIDIGTMVSPPPPWTENEEQKLLSALKEIKPIGNQTWFDVACGLKWLAKVWGNDRCYKILDDWSQRERDHYAPKKNFERWQSLSIDHPNPITLGTIYGMAEAQGWIPTMVSPLSSHSAASAVAPGQWPQPMPLVTKSTAAPYPIDALPATIREAVVEVQSFVKAPVAMVASSALAALSLSSQALVDVKRDEKLTGPVGLYFLTVADSGERKTSCDNIFMNAIRDYETQKEEEAKSTVKEYQAALKAWEAKHSGISTAIKEASKKGKDTKDLEGKLLEIEKIKPQPPKVQRLIYNDATPEALTHNLAKTYPAGGVITSEAGIVFGAHGMNKETIMRNLSTLNILWDGLTYRSDRQSVESCTLRGARLTVALQIQSATLLEFFDRSKDLARGSGFLARFLIAVPESTQGTRFYEAAPSHWPKLSAFHRSLTNLLAKPLPLSPEGILSPYPVVMLPEAKAIWIKFHDDIERELRVGGKYFDVRDVASKIADNAARLAAQFQTYEHGISSIGVAAIQSACKIAEWHLYEAQRFFSELALPQELMNASRLDRWLIEVCTKEAINTITCRRVSQYGPRSVREKVKMDAALRELVELGRVRVIADGVSHVIQVNPALLRQNDDAE